MYGAGCQIRRTQRKSRFFAGAVLAGLLVSGNGWADTDCNVPVDEWQSRDALRQQLDLLLEEICLRETKIGRSAAEQLAGQQRFLAAKKSR